MNLPINLLNNTSNYIYDNIPNEQAILDAQYDALGKIYNRFSTYLLTMIISLIVYVMLEKILIAQRDGYWRINLVVYKKDIPFNQSEDFIKVIKMFKGVLFGIMLAQTLLYFFIGRMFAQEMVSSIL